jgi:hypothetical protein
MNKINFIANAPWVHKKSINAPTPASKEIPEWYLNADRYAKRENGEYYSDPQIGGKIPTWKACPAIYDIFGTGYFFKTPCDIKFYEKNGKLHAEVKDKKYDFFIQKRDEMPQFSSPEGYRKEHFAWWPEWAPSLPDGYSALYSQPFNRFDLPFLNTSGIVDNDVLDMPGTIPFFVLKGWEGILPEGTPYVQILPFKREDWEHTHTAMTSNSLMKRNMENIKRFRIKDGGAYLNKVWHRRRYF